MARGGRSPSCGTDRLLVKPSTFSNNGSPAADLKPRRCGAPPDRDGLPAGLASWPMVAGARHAGANLWGPLPPVASGAVPSDLEHRLVGGRGDAAIADEELRRSRDRRVRRRRLGSPSRCRALAVHAGVAEAVGPSSPPAFEADAAEDRRSWLVPTASSTRATSGSTRGYVGATGASSTTHLRGDRALRARSEHALALEVICSPQLDRRQTQPHRRVPALGLPPMRPATRAASGWPVRLEDGPVRFRRPSMICTEAIRDLGHGRPGRSWSRHPREAGSVQVRTTVRPAGSDEVLSPSRWPTTRSPPANWWSGRSRWPTRAVVAWSLGRQPSTTRPSGRPEGGAGEPPRDPPPGLPHRSSCATGSPSSTASASS